MSASRWASTGEGGGLPPRSCWGAESHPGQAVVRASAALRELSRVSLDMGLPQTGKQSDVPSNM